jgi:hypothetical protein
LEYLNTMSQNTTLHVAPSGDGAWVVQKSGASRASTKVSTQSEAVRYARQIAKNQQTEVYIHGRDGRIRHRDSYGSDPLPPVRR